MILKTIVHCSSKISKPTYPSWMANGCWIHTFAVEEMSGSSCKHPYARRTCAKQCFSGQNEVVAPALMNLGAPPSNERNSFMKPLSNNEPNARSYSGDVRVVFITSQLGLDDLDVGPTQIGLQLKKTGFSHLNGWYWVNSPSTASFFSDAHPSISPMRNPSLHEGVWRGDYIIHLNTWSPGCSTHEGLCSVVIFVYARLIMFFPDICDWRFRRNSQWFQWFLFILIHQQ